MRKSRNPRREGFTLIELLVVIAIIGVLLGLLLPAVQKVRDAAARSECQHRARQLGLALHQYHDVKKALPPGHRSFRNREKMLFSGWPLSILPYLEQSSLYSAAVTAYKKSLSPFRDPPHTGLKTVVPALTCPIDDRTTTPQLYEKTKKLVAFTSYLGVSGLDYETKDGVLYQDSRVSFSSIKDGTSNTLLLGERPPSANFQFGWWYAGIGQKLTGSADMILGVREQNLQPVETGSDCGPGTYSFQPSGFYDPCGAFHFWSPHTGGANFVLCDGSVRFFAYSSKDLLPALASRAGGEILRSDDF